MFALGQVAVGIFLVIAGAELFFKGVLASAERLRVSPFVLTAVISGFELENLAAGIAANAHGLPDAAVGTFFGGATFLALGVAGLGSIVSPINARIPRPVLGWTALSPLPVLVFSLDGTLSRFDGGLLVAWFFVALFGIARSARGLPLAELEDRPRRFYVRLIAGLAVLSVGGELLGRGLREVISRFKLSETLLGNTAVAAGVEAEEVGRVAVPARRGRGDVAIANILGTIIHFIAFNAGVIALIKPVALGNQSLMLHAPAAMLSTLILCMLVLRQKVLGRKEGLFLVALYVAYVVIAVVASV